MFRRLILRRTRVAPCAAARFAALAASFRGECAILTEAAIFGADALAAFASGFRRERAIP